MTKILNLDKLSATSTRELVIGGKTYTVPDMTVENFIETTRAAADLAKNEEATMADQIEATIDMIVRGIPSITRDALKGYSLTQLGQIANFVRGEAVEGTEEVAAAAADANKEVGSGNA